MSIRDELAKAAFDITNRRVPGDMRDRVWASISKQPTTLRFWSELADATLGTVVARIRAEAWDEGQKSGLRYADRAIKAQRLGHPELPGPPTENPYRTESPA